MVNTVLEYLERVSEKGLAGTTKAGIALVVEPEGLVGLAEENVAAVIWRRI